MNPVDSRRLRTWHAPISFLSHVVMPGRRINLALSSPLSGLPCRLHFERRGDGLSGPLVVQTDGVQLEDGQTLALAPNAQPSVAGEDLLLLMTVRVLPASPAAL